MTGHLSVPGLLEDPSIPATLSNKILVEVLRKELGFRGLIVTDALDMGGVKNKLDPSEVAVRALLAGADVLLMPPDPVGARDAVVNAVESGRIPMARLDDAVLRILQLKGRLLLLQRACMGRLLIGSSESTTSMCNKWRMRLPGAASRWCAIPWDSCRLRKG